MPMTIAHAQFLALEQMSERRPGSRRRKQAVRAKLRFRPEWHRRANPNRLAQPR
jgi:hypothetical protein